MKLTKQDLLVLLQRIAWSKTVMQKDGHTYIDWQVSEAQLPDSIEINAE